MNEDGSNKHLLDNEEDYPFPLLGNNAQWSPDGSKVVFDLCLNCQVETNNDIYLFDIASKEVTKLTESHAGDTNPVWSPDGSRIAFVSNRDYLDADTLRFRKDLYAINSDGSKLQRLTNSGYAKEPIWQKKGGAIVFRSIDSSSGIYKLDLGTNELELVKKDDEEGVQLHSYACSDDGNKILITKMSITGGVEDSLMIYDIVNKKMTNLYSANKILRADWYINNN
jgi:Tol biopolymer transport system component